MTSAQLADRLEALEKEVARLASKISGPADPDRQWWLEDAGRFKDDPVFEEIDRLGKACRRSLGPRRRAKRAHT